MSKSDKNTCTRICSVGGEALMEGIMMRSPSGYAQVVRTPRKTISVEVKKQKPLSKKYKILGIPVVRGCVALIDSLSTGMKCLFRSAEISGLEEEVPEEEMGKVDKFLKKKLGDKLPNVIMTLSLVLALALSITLFFLLPNFIASLIVPGTKGKFLYNLIEGAIRILIFIGYMFLVSRTKDIKRVFMYHGAEHKTIFCFEHYDELTVDNARKYSKHHPRCGTAFLFVIMIISILIYSFLPKFDFMVWNMLLRLACLPFIAGIGYEFNKFCGAHENIVTKILRAPGLAMQRLTTVEPEDDMLEIAIIALKLSLNITDDMKEGEVIKYELDSEGNVIPEEKEDTNEA